MLPDALQGLVVLESGEAYFLVSDAAAEWEFTGVVDPPASVELAAGGNLVGYYGATSSVEEALGLAVAQVGVPGPATSIGAIFEFVVAAVGAGRTIMIAGRNGQAVRKLNKRIKTILIENPKLDGGHAAKRRRTIDPQSGEARAKARDILARLTKKTAAMKKAA